MHRISFWLAILTTLLLTACASTEGNYYKAAESASHRQPTLVGSKVVQMDPYAVQTAYAARIDGELVRAGKKGVLKPLKLSPGEHEIIAIWNQDSLYGRAVFTLQARPGARYVIVHERIDNNMVRIWIEDDAAHLPVSEPQMVKAADPVALGPNALSPLYMHLFRLR